MTGLPELPGEDLVRQGIRDLERGVETAESLLVSIGAPRVCRLRFELPPTFSRPSTGSTSFFRRAMVMRRTPATTLSFAASSASSAQPEQSA